MANIIKNGRVSQRDRPLSNEKTISMQRYKNRADFATGPVNVQKGLCKCYGYKDIKNGRISQHGRLLNSITYTFDCSLQI